MTEQYPPGYRDPHWTGDTHEDIHDHELKLDAEIIREGIERFGDRSEGIIDIAGDLMEQFFMLLEEDERVKDLGDEEYRFLLAVIRDGWNDSEGN